MYPVGPFFTVVKAREGLTLADKILSTYCINKGMLIIYYLKSFREYDFSQGNESFKRVKYNTINLLAALSSIAKPRPHHPLSIWLMMGRIPDHSHSAWNYILTEFWCSLSCRCHCDHPQSTTTKQPWVRCSRSPWLKRRATASGQTPFALAPAVCRGGGWAWRTPTPTSYLYPTTPAPPSLPCSTATEVSETLAPAMVHQHVTFPALLPSFSSASAAAYAC